MNLENVRTRIEAALNVVQLDIAADGNRLDLRIVSEDFKDLGKVKRQQLVYGALGDLISSGEVHAVTMQTMTPDE